MTNYERLKYSASPEDMNIILNANSRRFCPHEYKEKPDSCGLPCGRCVTDWLLSESTVPLFEPEPLTIDDLKQRQFSPVWVHFLETPSKRERAYWMIIGKAHGSEPKYDYFPATSFTDLINDLHIADYGTRWLAYDRPPKEVQKNG